MEKIRLLLVDDEENFRRAIARRLSKRGMAPQQGGSGEECLNILEKQPMDVIVLDVKMPGMSGLETLRHIKGKHEKSEVILLTGYANTEDGVEGIKLGAFDYLSKPVELEHLAEKIRQAYQKILREEEKKREVEFRARMEQRMVAAERLASLGTLAAGVAHEINNPLAIMNDAVGWLKLLLQKEEFTDMHLKQQLEKGFEKIEKSVERAKKITHQLLGFVRKGDSGISNVNLKQLAEESIELIHKEAKHKEIDFNIKAQGSVQTIRSDPYQLRQVFINLLTNAVHATGPKGKVSVTIEGLGDNVGLKIQDSGEGILKENLEKIFEPFFSTKSSGVGTGLGLFVTRGIIEKLGATIEVESELGKGTCFRIQLPRAIEREKDSTE
ncbi:ATP-binding protein [Thermodesulfobacteriota bacterium]